MYARFVKITMVALMLLMSPHGLAEEASDTKSTLTDITGIAPIQEAFNADKGLPRMLILLSPT